MKAVTVIIPTYNGIKFLPECLDSILHQDKGTPPYQVLVVDNGSRDGSLDLIKEKFPRVSLIVLESNTGFCHAVNMGIQAVKTPYVVLLNNDTKSESHLVRGLYDAIEADGKIFSVSARMLMWDKPELIDDAGDRYCVFGWNYSRGKGKPACQYDRKERIFTACAGAAIYRKRVFEEIGLFDEAHFAYLEDLDIGYRAGIHGYQNYYEPSAQVLHYGSASSGSQYNEWKTELAAANSVYVIAKNMPLLQLVWNLPFLLIGCFLKYLFFCRKGMGLLYLKGLGKGLRKSLTKTGRSRKVPFKIEHLGNYLAIQWQLYANTLRFFKKG